MVVLTAGKCTLNEQSYTNYAYVSPMGPLGDSVEMVEVRQDKNHRWSLFKAACAHDVPQGDILFNINSRKWAGISIGAPIEVRRFSFKPDDFRSCLSSMELELELNKSRMPQTKEPFDTEKMMVEFVDQFNGLPFTVGQLMVFNYNGIFFNLVVTKLEAVVINKVKQEEEVSTMQVDFGLYRPGTNILFNKKKDSELTFIGKFSSQAQRMAVINPDFDFGKIGIGGLDSEFNSIFRRAFASRLFPPDLIDKLGCKHVKGILLYGPPGTGKTLLARQIGKMLNTREPKIVNGPQILDKFVGESEANIRRLFADAEEEERQFGMNSALHIIIFDEMDAICKARGTVGGNTGVHDTVVNQLLSKIDGVDQLNNILIIGMTNRKDMIDEALLRPGRLEVQVEIGLPNEHGRVQILDIHTSKIRATEKLSKDVDIKEIAAMTKNFSGAELEGLVRAAQSVAMNRLISAKSKVEIDKDAVEKLRVERNDFLHALENDIKPAFGSSRDTLDSFLRRGIVRWGHPVSSILEDGALLCQQVRSTETSGLVSVLLEGPPNAGKTALAALLAKNSDFPFIKVCSPEDMVGFNESAKCNSIRKVFDDAYRSSLSCILVDNIERLLDYGPMGPRYSNLTLQALLVLLKKEPPFGRKLLILCTTSQRQVLEDMEMLSGFTSVLHVPNLNRPEHLLAVLEDSKLFNRDQLRSVEKKIHGQRVFVGIKKLLALVDLVRQTDEESRVRKFLTKMEEEGCLGETGGH